MRNCLTSNVCTSASQAQHIITLKTLGGKLAYIAKLTPWAIFLYSTDEMWKLHQLSFLQFTKQSHQVHAHEKKPHVSPALRLVSSQSLPR